LFDSRQFQEALLAWTENETSYYDYLKNFWSTSILSGKTWNKAVHDGLFVTEVSSTNTANLNVTEAAIALTQSQPSNGFERSEEHTSELQSRENLVCRLLLEKKN